MATYSFTNSPIGEEVTCKRCGGTGKVIHFYRDVADAHGVFYNQDIEYVLRSITVRCHVCKGVKDERAHDQGT